MKYKFIILIALIALIVLSCSKDNVTNNPVVPETHNYFTMTPGSWWKMEHYTLDNNQNKIDTSRYVDSIYSGEKIAYQGQNANVQYLYYDTYPTIISYYYTNSDNSILYCNAEEIDPSIDNPEIPIVLPAGWYKIADFNSTAEWTLLDSNFTNVKCTVPIIGPTNMSGNYKITCVKGTVKSISLGEKSDTTVNAQEFILTYIFDGSIVYNFIPLKIPFKIPVHYYYADNIGLVSTMAESATIDLTFYKYDIQGGQSRVLNYKITK